MSKYSVPDHYYFRLHHVRPRFKNDVESVLIYIAEEISTIGKLHTDEFMDKMNTSIRNYPGNAHRTQKTINNWRTEITSLFGFVEYADKTVLPGKYAIDLAKNQDLIEFFKVFLYNFQYPGAHVKPQSILSCVEAGVNFKPAQFILKLLRHANAVEKNKTGITKLEVCHCIFNDLRCTRDRENEQLTWKRIKENRIKRVEYDSAGDVVRYAGDIIDYMVIANLLVTYDDRTYYLNSLEEVAILNFIESNEWFSGYDTMINSRSGDIDSINNQREAWYRYVNRDLSNTNFATDILTYISDDEEELINLRSSVVSSIDRLEENDENKIAITNKMVSKRISESVEELTKRDIGDVGESLVHGHECMRIKTLGRSDLIHLIKRIPSHFAVGYDISSIEEDERKRYIEVKTTISSKPLHFNRIHLTKNEWNTANTTRESYYIYRLMISKTESKLFLLRDPVGLYKSDQIDMVPSTGADIMFNPEDVGNFEELLMWKN